MQPRGRRWAFTAAVVSIAVLVAVLAGVAVNRGGEETQTPTTVAPEHGGPEKGTAPEEGSTPEPRPTAPGGSVPSSDGVGALLALRRSAGGDADRMELVVASSEGSVGEPVALRSASPVSAILDWSPDATEAMVRSADGTVGRVALADGVVHPLGDEVRNAGFTRPLGTDTVVEVRQGDRQRIELRDGTPVATTWLPADDYGLPWLYGLDGTTILVGDQLAVGAFAGHLTLWRNDGIELNQLRTDGSSCRPLRWWTADQVLAACDSNGTPQQRSAGLPFTRLWLVPRDGGVPWPLTPGREASPAGAEHGFVDAQMVAPGVVLVQGEDGSGAAHLFARQPDGTVTPLSAEAATRLVGHVDGRATLWVPAEGGGTLITAAPDGSDVRSLDALGTVSDVRAGGWGPETVVDGLAVAFPPPSYDAADAVICPAPEGWAEMPGALDSDRDGRWEGAAPVDPTNPPPGVPAPTSLDVQMQEHTPGTGAVEVLASASAPRLDFVDGWWTWNGDLDGDGHAEAVLCVRMLSAAGGHPATGLFVFSRTDDTWRPALATTVSGGPAAVEASHDGISGTFRQVLLAGACVETDRRTFGWQDGRLVLRSDEIVDRTQSDPSVDCPWP